MWSLIVFVVLTAVILGVLIIVDFQARRARAQRSDKRVYSLRRLENRQFVRARYA